MKFWVAGLVLLVIAVAVVRCQPHPSDHEFQESNRMLDDALKLPKRK